MRVLRWFILACGILGGLAGLSATANSAPLPVAPIAGQTADTPLVQKSYYYVYRRRYWRPRYYYRRHYWRPRYYHRRHYWRPRYYRRHYWRPYY